MEVKIDTLVIDAAAAELIDKFVEEIKGWLENDPIELMTWVGEGKFPDDLKLLTKSAFKIMEVWADVEEMNCAKKKQEEKIQQRNECCNTGKCNCT